MDNAARAQEMWSQLTSKNLEMMTVWAEANQRMLKDWVELWQTTLTDAVTKTKEIYARAA